MRNLRLLFAVVSAPLASSAMAADLFDTHFKSIAGAKICYARTYDEAHLKTHPSQKVRRIELDFTRKPKFEAPPMSPGMFELGFGAQLRNATEWYTGSVICRGVSSGAQCFLEADGGEFRLTANGKSLRIDVEKHGLRFEGRKTDVEFAGDLSDDNAFVLSRASNAQCDASTAR